MHQVTKLNYPNCPETINHTNYFCVTNYPRMPDCSVVTNFPVAMVDRQMLDYRVDTEILELYTLILFLWHITEDM